MVVLSVPDLIITIAYFSIPCQIVIALWQYPRLTKRMASVQVIILVILFALFIFLCGAGHLFRCLGHADTSFFRAINILTAVVSLVTALYLVPFTPSLLARMDLMYLEISQSKKIIESMYPPNIRERLLRSVKIKSDRKLGGKSDEPNPLGGPVSQSKSGKRNFLRRLSDDWVNGDSLAARRIQDFIRRNRRSSDARPDFDVSKNIESGHQVSEPIAESFPDSSIMFADISNFTSWSSSHSPNDVFTLLESLFWEFDEIAKELGVFKLSTVGDCYIAATGVPYPQEDHALVLAQFAERCRRKANDVKKKLSGDLGMDGIDTLDMRFGIHSGPITAGVLRGQKSRFELFGDSINVASRMESTGVPGKIQVSQETAELIQQAGLERWVTPRDGFVEAKGKGKLQTYWLQIDWLEVLPCTDGCQQSMDIQTMHSDLELKGEIQQNDDFKIETFGHTSIPKDIELGATIS